MLIRNLILIFKDFIQILWYLPCYIIYRINSKARDLIKADIEAFYQRNRKIRSKGDIYLFSKLMCERCYRSVYYHRVGRIGQILALVYGKESTLLIFTSVKLGGGIYSAHAFSSVINAKSVGKNFSFRQSTTIGNKIDGRNDLVPTIGDNVILGSNVVIIGDVRIGDNVIIGAGSVVVKDIPSNSIVVGNPAKVLRSF